MRIVADFHIHSRFSRATSKDMNIETLSIWAKKKGINLLGTGDFTHPGWLSEIKAKLIQGENGFLSPKDDILPAKGGVSSSARKSSEIIRCGSNRDDIDFILTTEVSSIYTSGGKVRKIHNLIFAPTLSSAEKISKKLGERGNIWSDGRPIFGLSAHDITGIVLDVDSEAMIIPAHIWTPWFSLFGANSGFDTIEECYGDLADQIFAAETGLSSDPEMNWRLSKLDKITLISNSDSHSPAKIGREANVFDFEEDKFSYEELRDILKSKDASRFLYTIEFFPEEGKYHYSGHRNHQLVLSPKEAKKVNYICPVCQRKLTIGVSDRVEQLADREEGYQPKNFPASKHLVPLTEIIGDVREVGNQSKAVLTEYDEIVKNVGPEIEILDSIPIDKIKAMVAPEIAEAIEKVRHGKVKVKPGYDGVYGIVSIKEKETAKISAEVSEQVPAQETLF
jgi:uncharacterized protein (TIGR00375 family)